MMLDIDPNLLRRSFIPDGRKECIHLVDNPDSGLLTLCVDEIAPRQYGKRGIGTVV